MKRLIALCLFAMSLQATREFIEDSLYEGEVEPGDFVIRWAFQSFCNFVFDPRTGDWVWPTDYHHGVTFDPRKVKAGDIILVRNAPLFFKKIHPAIKHPYVIVTHGEHLEKMKDQFYEYLNEKKVIAWFGIHPSKNLSHPKYHQIPIGIIQQPENYKRRTHLHDLFTQIRATSTHKYMVYMNFADINKPERKKLRQMLGEKSFVKRGKRQPFFSYLKEMAQCKFTLSPKGLGIDCYRTWESLLVGSIPIVKTSHLDPIYDGLPVLIINNWEDITEEFLARKYTEIRSKKYDIAKLYMDYWRGYITAVRDNYLAHQ